MEGPAAAAADRWFTKIFPHSEPAKVERVLAMRATSVHGYVASCAALRDMDLREAAGITNEVLVIAGRDDMSTMPGTGALVARSIKGAKLVTLEALHMSSIDDEMSFNKVVLEFLTARETVFTKASLRGKLATKTARALVPVPLRSQSRCHWSSLSRLLFFRKGQFSFDFSRER